MRASDFGLEEDGHAGEGFSMSCNALGDRKLRAECIPGRKNLLILRTLTEDICDRCSDMLIE